MSNSTNTSNNRMMMIIAVVAIVVIIGAVVILGGSGNEPTTNTTPQGATVIPATQDTTNAMPSSINLEIVYNENFLAVRNPHPFAAANIMNLSLSTADEAELFEFGPRLDPGRCVYAVKQGQQELNVPTAWTTCGGGANTTLNSPLLWVADGPGDETFTVSRNDEYVTNCYTVGQAAPDGVLERTCTVAWTDLSDTR